MFRIYTHVGDGWSLVSWLTAFPSEASANAWLDANAEAGERFQVSREG
jgi:hypothetical protein